LFFWLLRNDPLKYFLTPLASPLASKSQALTPSVAQVSTAATATAFAAPGEDCIDASGSTVLASPTASPKHVVSVASVVTKVTSTPSASRSASIASVSTSKRSIHLFFKLFD
jgi:Ca2+/Na+ antiporter